MNNRLAMKGTMSRKEVREDNRRNREVMKEWTKQLGHKPTLDDLMRAMYSPAARRAAKEHAKQMAELGKADGRAWAESGRSFNTVEVVYNYCHASSESEADRLEAAMMKEIGDDDECPLLGDGCIDDVYADAWFEGVCDAFEEMRMQML